ncbi:hypothetical protein [Streptococcus mutans]|uniref:hypothetical protein n=1 Tax=Streptococcus mutans TaxID=1309 RepID=UPI002741FF39|nr:hypothetical protein [Streptococcus mutans]MDP5865715.1 hypothetical protein [Streptococcus mutans]
MKTKQRSIFLKQELFSKSVIVFTVLTLLMGAIIIISDGYCHTHYGASGIVGSYRFLTDIMFVFLGVSSFGKEFQYRTINMIRVSKLSGIEVLVRKWVDFILLALISASFLLVELAIYKYGYCHVEVNLAAYAKHIYPDFAVYAAFIYVLSTLVVLLLKSTLTSFLTVYFGVRALSYLCVYLYSFGHIMSKIMENVPFIFMEGIFVSGRSFSVHHLWVLLIWSIILLSLLPFVYKKRAFV